MPSPKRRSKKRSYRGRRSSERKKPKRKWSYPGKKIYVDDKSDATISSLRTRLVDDKSDATISSLRTRLVDDKSDATISSLRTRLAPLKVELWGAYYRFSSPFRDGSSVSRVETFLRPVQIFISNLPTQKEFQHNDVTYTDKGSYFLVGNMKNKDTGTGSWAFKYNVQSRKPRVELYEDSGGNAMVPRPSV
jgi:hypothetical protein